VFFSICDEAKDFALSLYSVNLVVVIVTHCKTGAKQRRSCLSIA